MSQQAPCRNCQQPLPQSGGFCPYCGVPIVPQADPYASYLETLPASRSDPNTPPGKLPLRNTGYGTEYDANLQRDIPPPPPNPPVDFGTTEGRTIYPNSMNRQPKKRMWSNPIIVVLLLVIILLLVSGMLLWLVVIPARTAQIATDATATANAQATATVIGATATAQAKATRDTLTATATANQNPYPPNTGTLILNDSLSQQTSDWAYLVSKFGYGKCEYANGGFTISTVSSWYCVDQQSGLNAGDFTLSADVEILQGDCGGLVFRDDGSGYSVNYRYYICNDGSYFLQKGRNNIVVKRGTSLAIKSGVSIPIAVVAQGNTMKLYAGEDKQHPIDVVTDTTIPQYKSGDVGLIAGKITNATSVVFSNVKLWEME